LLCNKKDKSGCRQTRSPISRIEAAPEHKCCQCYFKPCPMIKLVTCILSGKGMQRFHSTAQHKAERCMTCAACGCEAGHGQHPQ